ncbi:MAG: DinB family protein [Anaerolineae bacterium]
MSARPNPDEYSAYYGTYIIRVPEGVELLHLLREQPQELANLLREVSDERAVERPAPAEWNIKEIVGHLNDFERILTYRALRFARRDATLISGIEPLDYVREYDASRFPLHDLLDEFIHLRAANVLLFKSFSEEMWLRRGVASGVEASARALVYVIAGHVDQHLESLRTVYLK